MHPIHQLKNRTLVLALAMGVYLPAISWPQEPAKFVQVQLLTSLNTKSANVGDAVKASVYTATTLADGGKMARGAEVYGQVRSVDANSISISFDEAEVNGKKAPLKLSIQGAMMPGGDSSKPDKNAQGSAGLVVGMPGVTLQVDDGPQHASKFETSGKKLQLKSGLQLMLRVTE